MAKPALKDPSSARPAGAAFRGFRGLIADLLAHAPVLSGAALALLLAAAVTEAFGLALIIPLVYVTGLAAPSGNPNPVAEAVAAAAGRIGLELTVPSVLAVFLALAAVRAAVAWQRQQVLVRLSRGLEDRLRGDLYAATASAKWSHLARWRASDIHHMLTVEMRRVGRAVNLVVQLAARAVLALAQFAVALMIEPLISLGALAAGLALALSTVPLASRSARRGAQLTQRNRTVQAVVTGFLEALKLVKSYNAERRHLAEYAAVARAARRTELKSMATVAAGRAVLDLGAAVALAAVAYWAIVHSGLALPELLVLMLVFARLIPSCSQMQQFAQHLAHDLPAYVHTADMVSRLNRGAESGLGERRPPLRMRDALELNDVSFAYPASPESSVLAGLDLRIEAGEFLAVMGVSGAGKSTLADLLCGLLEPCGGGILLDGAPLTPSDARRWRDSAAYVVQDPYLFHESVRTNMLRADPKASDAELRRALARAEALDFVDALPEGLDTVVGDRGARLSSGERRRIALASGLLRNLPLLLLDEPTANLDAASARRIAALLASLCPPVTVVAMTHSPELARHARRVALLQSGRVAAIGRWSEIEPALGPAPALRRRVRNRGSSGH